ncbi:hypothetical protein CVT26_010326 [Gymnopilus dilepis]|uniref:Uncharacterized protein n=1 Tax=Gymnopilus dilepis TaxID=231916 RepID=A0A409Y101_9AGAR|nr:hypothetical protein CVT26_010326 [Gymnopilus dilepis]
MEAYSNPFYDEKGTENHAIYGKPARSLLHILGLDKYEESLTKAGASIKVIQPTPMAAQATARCLMDKKGSRQAKERDRMVNSEGLEE